MSADADEEDESVREAIDGCEWSVGEASGRSDGDAEGRRKSESVVNEMDPPEGVPAVFDWEEYESSFVLLSSFVSYLSREIFCAEGGTDEVDEMPAYLSSVLSVLLSCCASGVGHSASSG